MKKLLIILAIIIAAVFIYLSLKENKNNPKETTKFNNENQHLDSGKVSSTEEAIPPEIPEIYDLSNLTVDSELKPVKLNLPDSIKVLNSKIGISAKVPSKIVLCDLFLLMNNKKKDMFYQVKGGTYEFKNVRLIRGKNHVEIFYRIGKKRSPSSSSIIIKE